MGSKPLSQRLREKRNHPPPGQPWVWLSREILESEAWRTAPINTRRVVDRLLLEHMAHAGSMNGKLVCTYDDFDKWGVWRRRLSVSIRDAADRGLIVVTEKGRASAGENRWPNKYALGWLPMHDGAPALNKWKSWSPKSISPGGHLSTGEPKETANSLVDKTTPRTSGQTSTGKPRFSVVSPSGQTSTTSKILGVGATASTGCQTDARVTPPDRTLENPTPSKEGSNNFGLSEKASDAWKDLEIPVFLKRNKSSARSAENSDPKILALSKWGREAQHKPWTKPTILSDEPREQQGAA